MFMRNLATSKKKQSLVKPSIFLNGLSLDFQGGHIRLQRSQGLVLVWVGKNTFQLPHVWVITTPLRYINQYNIKQHMNYTIYGISSYMSYVY